MKVVFLTIPGTDGNTGRSFREVCDREGYDLEYRNFDSSLVDDDPLLYRELEETSGKADLVLIRTSTDPYRMKRFEKFEELLPNLSGYVYLHSSNLDVSMLYRKLFRGNDRQYMALNGYMRNKCKENDMKVMELLHNMLSGSEEIPEPVTTPSDGIYHPGFPDDVSPEEYLKHLDPALPTVGIVFPANLWSYRNTEHIDGLIEALEDAGMNVLPVFQGIPIYTTEDDRGSIHTIRKYFMDGDRRRIDALVVASPFSQLNTSRNSSGIRTSDEENFFHTVLDVPVFQVMSVSRHFSDYEEDCEGLNKFEINMSVYWPEMDGQIITVPVGSVETKIGEFRKYTAIEDRTRHIASAVKSWVELARTPRKDRRVAVLLYQSRPNLGRIGNSASLDSIESVNDMLKRFDADGYTLDHVPENGRALIDEILDNVTNDLDDCPPERVERLAVDLVSKDRYMEHYEKVPGFNRRTVEESWGEPVGEVCVDKGRIVIPGLVNGNIFVGYQPLRSWEDQMEAVYHDPVIPMTHQYLEFYRWLRYDFKANVVIHMGTHGTVEWLPGRNVGLSGKCFPDVVLQGMPNIYPFMIDDPGEGIQAKRRSEAVIIGHMCTIMARAGSYDEISGIEVPLQEYFKMREVYRGEQRMENVRAILDAVRGADMLNDLELPYDITPEEFEGHLFDLHDYITELKDAIIRDGLHILGRAPRDEQLDEIVYTLTKLRNDDIPSLRDSYAAAKGFDAGHLIEHPSELTDGEVNSAILDGIESEVEGLIRHMRETDFDTDACLDYAGNLVGMTDDLEKVLRYICTDLSVNLGHMTDEMDNLMHGCDGGYVLPGPSGAPTRGCAKILPMGRNYYGIDPDIIPPRSSWEIGRKMADQMIEHYKAEKGCYPHEIGFIIWATDTAKTNGDDLAYILWLMGVRPTWSSQSGHVTGLEIVPLSELGRPRMDVTVRITGLFRDMFPNLIDMIDDAVKMVADLDESEEDNYLAANLRKDIVESMAEGMPPDEARRRNSVRIFGCPPGGYGSGIDHAIATGEWETVTDIADIYAAWGSYAYGRGIHAESMKDQFVKRFSRVGITVKNLPDREIDMLDMDDVYGYLGGMNAFIRAYGRDDAISVMGDGSNPDNVKLRGTKEELQYIYRSKILNPKYIDGLKRHGYRGVTEVTKFTEFTFGWDATSDIVDDWVYEKLVDTYLFDDDTREWMKDENPHAMMEMMDRLMEAYDRGMWNARPETLERLKEIYLDLEERIEEVNDR